MSHTNAARSKKPRRAVNRPLRRLRSSRVAMPLAVVSALVLTTGNASGTVPSAGDDGVEDLVNKVEIITGQGTMAASSSESFAKTGRCADAGEAGEPYETASPEEVDLDPAKLQKALDYWSLRGSETLYVFRHNCLVGEGLLNPIFNYVPTWIRSHTKTLLSLVVGRAQTLGLLDIDDPIGKYIPKGVGDAAHRAITLRELLTMRSGLRMNWPREIGITMNQPNKVREAMSLPFDHEPGTWFEYAQNPMYLLPYTVQHAVGMDFQKFAQKELFDHLGIPENHYAWGRDRANNYDGPGWNTFAFGVDFGRIGQLLLNEGTFNGERLIERSYLRQATTGTEENAGYGMPFWLNSADRYVNASIFEREIVEGPIIPSAPRDLYMTWGLHGQHVFVIPSLDMVITRTGNVNPDAAEAIHDPGNAAITGRQKFGYYQFFKLMMQAVSDKNMPEPPPYDTEWSLDLDPSSFTNPEDALAALSLGPAAPEGCTALGCDGVDYRGAVDFALDVANTLPATLGGTVPGFIGQQQALPLPDNLPKP